MKSLFCISFLVFIVSCQISSEKSRRKSHMDSLDREVKVDSIYRKLKKERYNMVLWDTVGIAEAPVKVISARIVQKKYSSYKNIQLGYKNVSDKKIEAIRFAWYGETAFGEPADLGSFSAIAEGFGGGYDDDGLRAGKTKKAEWEILSRNVKKLLKVWPTEVVFEDGTKWQSESNK